VFENPTNIGVIGFWIVGLDAAKRKFELYEICWPGKSAPFQRGPMVLGGDGKKFLNPFPERLGPFHLNKLHTYSVRFVLQYHEALYQHAESKQVKTGQVVFGGHQHRLIMNKPGWKWEKPPKSAR
jgi:hypothetical protein